MSDLAEFMEQVGSEPVRPKSQKIGRVVDSLNAKEQSGDKESTPDWTQYVRITGGYTAAGKTSPTLPPASYTVRHQDGRILFLDLVLSKDDLLPLPDSKSDMVLSEAERFWTLKPVFDRFGLLHKRGFLLWGPPGAGKTSTVTLIAEKLIERGGLVLYADDPTPMALGLSIVRKVEPDRPVVVVLEDIDTIISRHGEHETLALLDGEASVDNVLFIATTNYPEKLDGRIANRPSRFDRIVKIDTPSAAAREAYFQHRKVDAELIKRWVELSEGFSVAHMKEMIIAVYCFDEKLEAVVERLRSMKRIPKSESGHSAMGFS